MKPAIIAILGGAVLTVVFTLNMVSAGIEDDIYQRIQLVEAESVDSVEISKAFHLSPEFKKRMLTDRKEINRMIAALKKIKKSTAHYSRPTRTANYIFTFNLKQLDSAETTPLRIRLAETKEYGNTGLI
jgi:hypothetical protein